MSENNTGLPIVWIDVRSTAEYATRQIDGHINIEHESILSGLEALNTPKEQIIKLYCRTGRRSGIAARVLTDNGFLHVSNAGSIDEVEQNL